MSDTTKLNPEPGNTNPAGGIPPAGETPSANPSKPWLKIGVAVLAVAVVGAGAWWLMKNQTKPAAVQHNLKIGVMTNDGDSGSNSAGSIRDAVKLARQQVTVDGVTVEIIAKTTKCDKTLVPGAMQELIDQGVVAVIGEQCSGATLAGTPLANTHRIPLISPASTSPKLSTDGGAYFFRTIPSDALAAEFTADYLYNQAKSRKLAIIYGDETYGTSLRDSVKAGFEKLGGSVVATGALADENVSGATVAGYINALKAAKADAIYIVSNFAASNVTVALKLKEMGVTVPVYGAETFSDTAFIKDAGVAANGFSAINVSQGTPSFIEKAHAAWGTDPQIYAAQAYDAYAAIMKAVGTGAYTGPDIRAALTKVSFDGASGHIQFDEHGDVPGNYSVFTIKDGKLIPPTQ